MRANSQSVLRIRIRDPVPGSGIGKKSGSGSGMNNPNHISPSPETIFWVKILKFVDGIRDEKNSDPEFGMNIPYPQHCLLVNFLDDDIVLWCLYLFYLPEAHIMFFIWRC
jgi:hypothetical protein